MSTTRQQRRHPAKQTLSLAVSEDRDRLKARKGLIQKRQTLIKATADEAGGDTGSMSAAMVPNDEQLARINQFTLTPKAADQVAAFSTLSMNDLVDRDDEQFTTQSVEEFAALPQPYSPIGKSFMVDHSRSVSGAVGRIFGVDTKKVGSALHLTNEVYVPRTEKNAAFLEDQDFGVNWAVSVGVVLAADHCSVCALPFDSWGLWCQNGHDKGAFYDPKSTEEDAYGWPLAVDPGTTGAVKCIRVYSEPVDFYELSQVFLGAQYYAALESKAPALATAIKSAGGILGLSAEEASEIPLPREPKKLAEARTSGYKIKTVDGLLRWTDSESLVWVFDPEDPDAGVSSIGRETITDEDNDDKESADGKVGQDELDQVRGLQGDASGGAVVQDAGAAQVGAGDGVEVGSEGVGGSGGSAAVGSGAEGGLDGSVEGSGEVPPVRGQEGLVGADSDGQQGVPQEVTVAGIKAAVLSALKNAGLPEAVSERVSRTKGSGLDALMLAVGDEMETLRKEADALRPKAALGDRLVKEKRADAIHWYVVSRGAKHGPVPTDAFEKVLDAFGANVDLIEAQIEDAKSLAKEKFPAPVRRSSAPDDPHLREELEIPTVPSANDKRVSSLHG